MNLTMTNSDIDISVLNNLIETLNDGHLGYEAANKDATDPELKELFHNYSKQREEFAAELQNVVVHLGGTPEHSGSVSGAIHRGWVNLKSAAGTRDNFSVLEECEDREDYTLAEFKTALDSGKLGRASNTVQREYEQIQAAHDEVRTLRDLYSTRSDSDGEEPPSGSAITV